MLISRGCPWASLKRGGCKFGGSKPGAVLCQKRGAVVSQLVPKLKESVPPVSPGYGDSSHVQTRKKYFSIIYIDIRNTEEAVRGPQYSIILNQGA